MLESLFPHPKDLHLANKNKKTKELVGSLLLMYQANSTCCVSKPFECVLSVHNNMLTKNLCPSLVKLEVEEDKCIFLRLLISIRYY